MDFKARFQGKTSQISKEGVESALYQPKPSENTLDPNLNQLAAVPSASPRPHESKNELIYVAKPRVKAGSSINSKSQNPYLKGKNLQEAISQGKSLG